MKLRSVDMADEFLNDISGVCNVDYAILKSLVLRELDASLSSIDPVAVEQMKNEILKAKHVFFVGVGRVLLTAQCVVKRLSHIGISAHYVGEITEPAIAPGDLLVVVSGSGSTMFPLAIAQKAKSLGARVVHVGSNPESPMKEYADFMLRIPVRTKQYLPDEIDSVQLMTSLFEQSVLLLGDILAMMIVYAKGIDIKALWMNHANLE